MVLLSVVIINEPLNAQSSQVLTHSPVQPLQFFYRHLAMEMKMKMASVNIKYPQM